MTAGGYIMDRTCPANPGHGKVVSYESGHYCPHSDHTTSRHSLSQSFWTDDEFEAAKSATTPVAAPVKLRLAKKKRAGRARR